MVVNHKPLIMAWIVVWLSALVVPVQAELQVGETLDQSSWQQAKGQMPDALLRRFADGHHLSTVIAVPPEALRWGTRFLSLTEANAGKYAINPEGVLIETATGTWPRYTDGGFPFPQLEATDPQLAYKIMYNPESTDKH